MSDVSQKIQDYIKETQDIKSKMCCKLFSIFTETTGYRPEDLCLVEQQIVQGLEYKTIYFFDWKHKYQQGKVL